MAHINLLPWREELRTKRKRDFGVLVAVFALLTALLVVGVHLQINHMIERQEFRNQYLNQEIAKIDKIIREIQELEKTKERLLARMDVIQQLQGSRPQIVHLFDELVGTIPEGVYLTKFKQEGKGLVLDGRAESNARVSAYMRNIDASDWVGKPSLVVVQTSKGKPAAPTAGTGADASAFELRAVQVSPSEEEQ